MKNDEEIWKTYPEYPFIEASNLGRIRTVDRWVTYKDGRKRFVKGHVLKQCPSTHGYMEVNFSVNGKMIHLKTHRVIAICFIPNPDNLPEVNHIDNDKTNNVVSNLEWCTHEYNIAYREKFGVSAAEAFGHPVIAINIDTLEIFWFESQQEATRQLGVHQSNIYKVLKGQRNKTGGCWFTYVDENAVEKTRAKFGDEIAEKVEKLMCES